MPKERGYLIETAPCQNEYEIKKSDYLNDYPTLSYH